MQLQKVIYCNYKSHEYSVLDFTKFTTALILGKLGKDFSRSNGAGKSVLFDGIDFCIFNFQRDEAIDSLRHGETSGYVKVYFKEADSTYLIKRTLKRKGDKVKSKVFFKVKTNNVWDDLTDYGLGSKASTQKKICDTIKSDQEMFLNTSHILEGEIDQLMKLKSKDRREVFSRPEGLLTYQAAFKIAKKSLSEVNAKFKVTCDKVLDFREQYKSRFSDNESIEFLKKSLREKNKEIEKVNSEISDIEKSKDKHSESESAKRQIKILRDAIDSAKNQVEKIETDEEEVLTEGQAADEKIDDLTTKIKATKQNTLISDIAYLTSQIENLTDKIKEKRNLIEDLQNRKDKLKRVCESCGNQLNEEQYKKAKRSLINQLQAANEDLEKLYEDKDKAKTELPEIQERLNKVSLKIKEKDRLIQILNSYSEVWNRLEQAKINYKSIKTENESKIQVLEKKVVKTIEDNDLSELKEEYNSLSRIIGSIQQKIDTTEKNNDKKLEEIKKFKKLIREKLDIKKEKKILSYVKLMMSNEGIQSDIINEAIPELERYSNNILSKFENPSLELKILTKDDKGNDTFDWIVKKKDQWIKYNSISSGQKMRVAFAFRIGNSIRCSHVRGCNIDFLLIDEIATLDEAGIIEFMQAISQLSKIFKHILIISHIQEMKEYFSTQIIVTQKNEISSVKIFKNGKEV